MSVKLSHQGCFFSWVTCRRVASLLAAIGIGMLTACASGPIKTEKEISDLSVKQARAAMTEDDKLEEWRSDTVFWGGVILGTQNLEAATQLEVMAYPLDRRQRPMLGRDPEGRILVSYEGFLEPVDYAEGRSISLLGEISGVSSGTVGEAQYNYPTVDASDIHLWNESELSNKPRVSFGIGVNIGL